MVLHSHHPIFLHPYHFLKLVSFLGAKRTKGASVGPRLLGALYKYLNIINLKSPLTVSVQFYRGLPLLFPSRTQCNTWFRLVDPSTSILVHAKYVVYPL